MHFICAREAEQEDSIGPLIRKAFGGTYIANENFTRESAEQALNDGVVDAVAFGKAFIANPDLVARFAAKAPLNTWDDQTFFGGGAKGYIDYPTLPHTV